MCNGFWYIYTGNDYNLLKFRKENIAYEKKRNIKVKYVLNSLYMRMALQIDLFAEALYIV